MNGEFKNHGKSKQDLGFMFFCKINELTELIIYCKVSGLEFLETCAKELIPEEMY